MWEVWGDGVYSLFQGTEEEAKRFVEKHPDPGPLYIQGPDGEELMLNDVGRWVPAA